MRRAPSSSSSSSRSSSGSGSSSSSRRRKSNKLVILIVIIGVEEEATSLSEDASGLCLAETNPPLSDFPKDRPCTNKRRVLQGCARRWETKTRKAD